MNSSARRLVCILALCASATATAQPYGLDARVTSPAYLSMPSTETAVPPLLSQAGVFDAMSASVLTPRAALVPYAMNQPFWSDSAVKTRWIALPYDSTAPGSSPQIAFTEGEWTFPDGTVFVKHFELVVNEQSGAKRRLETRVLVRKQGGHVYGRSYRWRPDGTDADSVEEAASGNTELITITQADGSTRQQTWLYPKPSQCQQCHTTATGGVLGVKTRQLNGNLTYAATGRTDNQLRTWGHLGMLSAPFAEGSIASYLKLASLQDTTRPLLDRVRSYLDANCAQCHRPGATGIFDARYDTPIASQQIFGQGRAGDPNKLVRFSTANSRIIARDSVRSAAGGMPPVAKDVVDAEWIAALTAFVNDPFDVRSATSYGDPTKVRLAFTQQVSAASAMNLANYSIPGFTVTGASVSQDSRIVTVTLGSPLATSTNYDIAVNGVAAAASGNLIFPNTRRTFQVDVIDPNGDEDLDGIPNSVEVAESRNLYEKDNDVFALARLFAMQQYRDFLGREGDAGGIDFWTNQISGGTQTRAQMAETFFNSAEFQGFAAPVARLYFAYFLRIPDYGGLNFWIGQFRGGTSLEAISNQFAGSVEFTNTYGALDNAGFVDRVYRNVLGRPPDSGGLAYWKGQLDGGMTRGQMMVAFSESAEYRGLIGNEVYVTMIYTGMLRRSPDAGGFAFWVNYLDAGNSGLALTQGFIDATEYRSRFLP